MDNYLKDLTEFYNLFVDYIHIFVDSKLLQGYVLTI